MLCIEISWYSFLSVSFSFGNKLLCKSQVKASSTQQLGPMLVSLETTSAVVFIV